MKSSPANYLQFLVHTLVLVVLGHDVFSCQTETAEGCWCVKYLLLLLFYDRSSCPASISQLVKHDSEFRLVGPVFFTDSAP